MTNLERKLQSYINFSKACKDAAFMRDSSNSIAKENQKKADEAKKELDKAKEFEKEHKSADNKDWNDRLANNVKNKEKAYTDATHDTVKMTNVASDYQKKTDKECN